MRRVSLNIGYVNFADQHEHATDLITRDRGHKTVNVLGAADTGKTEFLHEVWRRHKDRAIACIADVTLNEVTPEQLVKDIQQQMGIGNPDPVVPPIPAVEAKFSAEGSTFNHSHIEVGLGPAALGRDLDSRVERILNELRQEGTRFLLLLDGIDRCPPQMRGFLLNELLPALSSCARTVIFVASNEEITFSGLTAMHCLSIQLGSIDLDCFLEACHRIDHPYDDERLEVLYSGTDRTIGGACITIANSLAYELRER